MNMTIIEREQQILRVSQQGVHHSLDKALATQLRTEVVSTVKTVLENALQEEVRRLPKKYLPKKGLD